MKVITSVESCRIKHGLQFNNILLQKYLFNLLTNIFDPLFVCASENGHFAS